MSGTKAFTYSISRNGRMPQTVIVEHDGKTTEFLFGAYVTEKRIIEQLPRLLLDFRTKRRAA